MTPTDREEPPDATHRGLWLGRRLHGIPLKDTEREVMERIQTRECTACWIAQQRIVT